MNPLERIENVIAQRKFYIEDQDERKEVYFLLGKPQKDPSGDYFCEIQIVGQENSSKIKKAFGVDAIQALQLAMKMGGSLLYTSKPAREGKLVWLDGKADLGLPNPYE